MGPGQIVDARETRAKYMSSRIYSVAALIAASMCFALQTARAGEGGSSGYVQGAYNDFQAGIFGPAGLYYRNDLAFYNANIGARPLGGRVSVGIDEDLWINLSKFAYLTDNRIFGARYGFAVTVPVVINAHVAASASAGNGLSVFRSGDVGGIGDLYINPIMLNWKSGNHNFTFAPAIVAPTGRYDSSRALNTGRNYWSIDVAGSYTWFDPKTGHEISMTAGVLFNFKNPATDYHTGTEFHLDWLAAQYFSQSFGLGVAGYFYQQIESDSGTIVGPISVSDFRGSGAGLGPALIYNIPVGKTVLSIIGKALFDVHSENRFRGNLYMLSAAFKVP